MNGNPLPESEYEKFKDCHYNSIFILHQYVNYIGTNNIKAFVLLLACVFFRAVLLNGCEHGISPYVRLLTGSGDWVWMQSELTLRYKTTNETSTPHFWEIKARIMRYVVRLLSYKKCALFVHSFLLDLLKTSVDTNTLFVQIYRSIL